MSRLYVPPEWLKEMEDEAPVRAMQARADADRYLHRQMRDPVARPAAPADAAPRVMSQPTARPKETST